MWSGEDTFPAAEFLPATELPREDAFRRHFSRSRISPCHRITSRRRFSKTLFPQPNFSLPPNYLAKTLFEDTFPAAEFLPATELPREDAFRRHFSRSRISPCHRITSRRRFSKTLFPQPNFSLPPNYLAKTLFEDTFPAAEFLPATELPREDAFRRHFSRSRISPCHRITSRRRFSKTLFPQPNFSPPPNYLAKTLFEDTFPAAEFLPATELPREDAFRRHFSRSRISPRHRITSRRRFSKTLFPQPNFSPPPNCPFRGEKE